MTSDLPPGPAAAVPGPGIRPGRGRRGALAVFAFVARATQQLSTLVITLLAARFLTPADYGVYALAIVFVTLIQTLSYTGFYHFIVTAKEDDRAVEATSFWLLAGLSVAASALLALAAPQIAAALHAPELNRVLQLLALVQPVAGLGAWYSAVLLRRKQVNRHFLIMFLQNAIALVGGVLLLWWWQSLLALVAFRFLRVLSAQLLYGLLTPIRPGRGFDPALARQALRYSGGLYGSRLLSFLQLYAGDLLLGLMFTTAEAGLYRFGNRIAGGAVEVVQQPMSSFALTQLGAAARQDRDLSGLIARFAGTVTVLTGGVAATVIVFAPTLMTEVFNPAYAAGIGVTYAMAMRAVFGLGGLLLEPALAAQHKTRLGMMFNLVFALATVLAVALAAPFGLGALAWSQAGTSLLGTAAALWLLRREGIAIGAALRALSRALGLVLGYGLALALVWPELQAGFGTGLVGLGLGLAAAAALGASTLLLGWRLRVVSLSAFSG